MFGEYAKEAEEYLKKLMDMCVEVLESYPQDFAPESSSCDTESSEADPGTEAVSKPDGDDSHKFCRTRRESAT